VEAPIIPSILPSSVFPVNTSAQPNEVKIDSYLNVSNISASVTLTSP